MNNRDNTYIQMPQNEDEKAHARASLVALCRQEPRHERVVFAAGQPSRLAALPASLRSARALLHHGGGASHGEATVAGPWPWFLDAAKMS